MRLASLWFGAVGVTKERGTLHAAERVDAVEACCPGLGSSWRAANSRLRLCGMVVVRVKFRDGQVQRFRQKGGVVWMCGANF